MEARKTIFKSQRLQGRQVCATSKIIKLAKEYALNNNAIIFNNVINLLYRPTV